MIRREKDSSIDIENSGDKAEHREMVTNLKRRWRGDLTRGSKWGGSSWI